MNKNQIRIVKIISSKQLVINRGALNGINKGNRFTIVNFNTEPIIDPETKENLGVLRFVKAEVEATIVYPKMTIVESPKVIIDNYPLTKHYIRPDLNIDPTEITGGFSSTDKTIKIGDIAIPED